MTPSATRPRLSFRQRLRSLLLGWPGRIVLGLIVLTVAGYYFENRRGARALEQELDIMRDRNIAVDWRDLLRGPVPDAENFGATPVLHGLAAESPDHPLKVKGMEALNWETLRVGQPAKQEDWNKIREQLAHTGFFGAPTAKASDARAVYAALDRMEPVFAELAAAADRRVALFTPSPKERVAAGDEAAFIWPQTSKPLAGLTKLLELRAAAAVELGEAGEALRMVRILRRMYEASQLLESPHALPPFLSGITADGVRRHVWSAAHLEELARYLAVADPAAVTAGCYHRFMLQDYAATLEDWSGTFRFPSGNWWRVRAGPRGWADQGRAELLRVTRERLLLPLREHGVAALMNGKAGVQKGDHSALSFWPSSWIFQFKDEVRTTLLFGEMMRRLTLLAIAVEQHRLKHGQPPGEAAPILTALPPDQQTDLDGKPLRLEMSKDRKSVSVYSVGENLLDDGNAATERGLPSPKNYDWSVQMPLP